MKSKFLNLFSKAMIGAIFISGPLLASDEDKAEQERISVGSRALSQDETQNLIMKKARLLQKIETGADLQDENVTLSEAETKEVAGEKSPEEAAEFVAKAIKSNYYTSHSGAYHSPVAISFLGDAIELEDGSIWDVYSGDRYKTLNWMTGDTIIIVPNSEWLSSYSYKLVNINTGAQIKVNLSLGPIYNGIYTHWIVAIDYFHNEIVLEDGTFWKMSSLDSSVYENWLPNDTIIIGVNDGWFSGSNPNIMINVNTNTNAMGKCIY